MKTAVSGAHTNARWMVFKYSCLISRPLENMAESRTETYFEFEYFMTNFGIQFICEPNI